MKKLLSILLTGAMVFSVSASALAATTVAKGTTNSITISDITSKEAKSIKIDEHVSTETIYTIPVGATVSMAGTHNSRQFAYGLYAAQGDGSYLCNDGGMTDYSWTITADMKGQFIQLYCLEDRSIYAYCMIGDKAVTANSSTPATSTKVTSATTSTGVKIDTGSKLTVKAGKTYQFKLTASSKPKFTSGNGSVFKVTYAGHKGNDYFYKAEAVGKVGQSAGFYMYVKGGKAICTVGTIV